MPQQQSSQSSHKGIGEMGWFGIGIGLLFVAGVVIAGGPGKVATQVGSIGKSEPTPIPPHKYTEPLPGEEVCDNVVYFLPIVDPATNTPGIIINYVVDNQGNRASQTIWNVSQKAMMEYDATSGCMGETRGDDYWFTAAQGAVLNTSN